VGWRIPTKNWKIACLNFPQTFPFTLWLFSTEFESVSLNEFTSNKNCTHEASARAR
jgi:hypothetical protein